MAFIFPALIFSLIIFRIPAGASGFAGSSIFLDASVLRAAVLAVIHASMILSSLIAGPIVNASASALFRSCYNGCTVSPDFTPKVNPSSVASMTTR